MPEIVLIFVCFIKLKLFSLLSFISGASFINKIWNKNSPKDAMLH